MDAPTFQPPFPAPHPLPCPPPEAQRSINSEWIHEADRFKWIMSEKAGRDLGEAAIRQWVRDHWWGFLRARWMEHLQGKCFWIELDRGDFGLLDLAFQDQKDLLRQIVERMKDGKENLDILIWAIQNQLPLDPVYEILSALDMNSRRLVCKFHTTDDPVS